MIKLKFFVDFAKEEQYLNDMAKKGFRLERRNSLGLYVFKHMEPQNLQYRIDYRVFQKKAQFEEYCMLFRDAGWEHVYGKRHSGTQYFLPITGKAQTDDIFSDDESKAERYKRFVAQCMVSMMTLVAYMVVFSQQWTDWSIWNVKSWYFTPGLWDMSGILFWKAFLFETPFVLLRVLPPFVFFLLAVLYCWWALKAKKLYKK